MPEHPYDDWMPEDYADEPDPFAAPVPPSADRIEKAARARANEIVATWWRNGNPAHPDVLRERIVAALAASTDPPTADRIEKASCRHPFGCQAPGEGCIGPCPVPGWVAEEIAVAYEHGRAAALAVLAAPQPIQWDGSDESYAAIEALGLPGLRSGGLASLCFDGPRGPRDVVMVYPGDWLVPEPVTTWRVSTGPSVPEPSEPESPLERQARVASQRLSQIPEAHR